MVAHDQENLTYKLNRSGQHVLQIIVMDSGGGVLEVDKYINVTASKTNNNNTSVLMILYNALSLPFSILFLAQNFIRRRFSGIGKYLKIVKKH